MLNKNLSQILLLENIELKNLPKPEILVFDLDLTLHNVIDYYDHAVNQTLKYFGYPELDPNQLKIIADNFTTSNNLFEKLLPNIDQKETMDYYFKFFLEREISPNTLLPGARELLFLSKKRCKLLIVAVTNADEVLAKKILQDTKTIDFFDYIIGIKDSNLPKPSPQMLYSALGKLSVNPGPHVWFVGDKATDTECAKLAGCTAIRFYHDQLPKDVNADLFIDNHYYLFNLINEKLKT